MTRFLLIRHANTNAVGKTLAGRLQSVTLNEAGSLQATALAARLQQTKIAAVYTSPLARAVQTAAPIASKFGLEAVVSEDFIELDFGEWTGLSIASLEDDPTFRQFNMFRSNTRIPGGELMAEAQTRMVAGLARLADVHAGENVAVVSHSDLIKATLAFYAGIHLDMFQRLEISPASVSIVELYGDTARILLINDTGSLPI